MTLVDALEHRGKSIQIGCIAAELQEEGLTLVLRYVGMLHINGNNACRLTCIGLPVCRDHQWTALDEHGDVLTCPTLVSEEEVLALLEAE